MQVAYERMKSTNIKSIGQIPITWDLIKLKFFSDIYGRIGFRGYTASDLVGEGEGAITLGPSNIENQKLNLNEKKYVSWEKYDESPEIKIYNDDLLFVKTASVGKIALVENLDYPSTINPQLSVFKNIQINNKYFYYAMISEVIQDQIASSINGGVISTLSQENIQNYVIPLPPINEQKQIANYLDKKTDRIDKTIAKNKELIKLLEEKRIALINHFVTKGLSSNVPMKDSNIDWLDQIPEHWVETKLKYISTKISKRPKKEDEMLVCSNSGKVIFRKDSKTGLVTEKEEKLQKVEKGDLLIHGMDTWHGAIAISDYDGKCTPVVHVCKSNEDVRFLKYYLQSLAFRNVYKAISNGIRENTSDFRSWEKTGSILIILPPLKEQIEISDYIDNEIYKIELITQKMNESIELLVEYKTSLIHQVVTGKMKVSNEV